MAWLEKGVSKGVGLKKAFPLVGQKKGFPKGRSIIGVSSKGIKGFSGLSLIVVGTLLGIMDIPHGYTSKSVTPRFKIHNDL